MLRLLSILQAQHWMSGPDLAERLEVSPRTLRRDVDRLRGLGYPVHAVTGAGGGYRLEAGTAMPPLLLDDDEAVAIAVGLRTAAGGTVTGMEEASLRALAKLEQVLPSRLRRRVNALQTYTVPLARSGPTVDADVLVAIVNACRDHEELRFDYRRRDGTRARATSNRTVSCPPASGGTWWPGTSTGTTGAPSGSTASTAPGPRVRASTHGACPPPTPPPTLPRPSPPSRAPTR
jgi:predicted DNA-binding transcriptional regulator YafY